MKYMNAIKIAVVAAVSFFCISSFAEPTSPPGYITQLRAYANGYVYLGHTVGICGTNTFTIDTNTVSGKAEYAAALMAFTLNKTVDIEVPPNVPCAWGMPIQSIYVNQ